MKTILYNIETNQTVGKIRQVSFNGIWNSALSETPGWLPEHIVELLVVETDQPGYDKNTQMISSHWVADVEEELYTQEWTVHDIPQSEINYNNALQDWPYPLWRKRIVAPIELGMDEIGSRMYVWFQLNRFPINTVGTNVHLYCNVILPQHQEIIDALAETISVEERPEILTPENNVE